MSDAVSARLRRLVVQRANGLCEYRLIHQDDAHFSFQVDHIDSRKQRGPTNSGNLALACLRCNVAKGTDPDARAGNRVVIRSHLRSYFDRGSDTGCGDP